MLEALNNNKKIIYLQKNKIYFLKENQSVVSLFQCGCLENTLNDYYNNGKLSKMFEVIMVYENMIRTTGKTK